MWWIITCGKEDMTMVLGICAVTGMIIMLIALIVLVKAVGNLQINLTVKHEYSAVSGSADLYDKEGNLIVEGTDAVSEALDEAVKAINAIMTEDDRDA